MLNGFILKKGFCSAEYNEAGVRVPYTRLVAMPIIVTQLKTPETDGYSAVQVAYGTRKKISQPIEKKLKKIKATILPKGFMEFRATSDTPLTISQAININEVFKVGDLVVARGTSKGRGFQGVIKRHGFKRQGETGGASNKTRAPGAIGAQTPGKVLKGKRMPGHMGNKTITVENLKIVKIEDNSIFVKGSVPGHLNSWLVLYKA